MHPRQQKSPANLVLFVHPFDCLFTTQHLRNGSLVFSNFLHEVRKSQCVRRAKNGPKMRFWWGLTKILSIHMNFFFLNMKFLMIFQLSVKTAYLEKIYFLSYGPKTSTRTRMQDSWNQNISEIVWGMNLNFWIWLKICRNNK